MNIETIPLDQVRPYGRNPRKHSDLQIREMAKSIERFGQIRPAVIDDDGVILAGHGIRLALLLLGRDTIEVLRKTGLTEAEKKKLVLADNKLAELGSDDYDKVLELVRDLDDFEIPGYDPKVLDDLLRSSAKALEDYGTLPIAAETVTSNFFAKEEPAPERPPEPKHEEPAPPAPRTEASSPAVADPLEYEERSIVCPHCGGLVPV